MLRASKPARHRASGMRGPTAASRTAPKGAPKRTQISAQIRAALAPVMLAYGIVMCGISHVSTVLAATETVSQPSPAFAYHPDLRPVHAVSSTMIRVDGGLLPVYSSADLDQAHPQIVRAVIVVHGKLRNADSYFATIQHAESLAGDNAADTTLILAPQFLATLDIAPNRVSDKVLRWQDNAWMAGEPAVGPAPVSSYRALDVLITQLADRQHFPNLREIIIAGHSGGAQVAQRYAVASHNGDALAHDGIRVRFLLSSPSTYAYFDTQRPVAVASGAQEHKLGGSGDNSGNEESGGGEHGSTRHKVDDYGARMTFAPFDAAACPAFDEWKYGMRNRPAYLAADDPKTLESAYVLRDVTYLVGGNDDSPTQKAMDKSCPAEAQGSNRVIRAESYYAYLQQRHPGLHQRFHVVPDVGHNQAKMLTSVCALHVMFGKPGCSH